MATIKAILEHGGVHRKLTTSPVLLILDHTEIGLILKLRYSPFILQ